MSENNKSIIYLDVETQRSSDEVGGWHNIDKMGISVAGAYSTWTGKYTIYKEGQLHNLFSELNGADLVVGFNICSFDFTVLSSYTDLDFDTLPVWDMFDQIKRCLGYRVSLNRLVKATLGTEKSADGLQALEWYKEGNFEALELYCLKDVQITRRLFAHACEKGKLSFADKDNEENVIDHDTTLWRPAIERIVFGDGELHELSF